MEKGEDTAYLSACGECKVCLEHEEDIDFCINN
jgi:hypothetical protein